MAPSPKTSNDLVLEKLAESLDSTSKLTHALLTEIRESETDFAVIKTELAILRDNVKGLSTIIREGNGATSILTKIALIEQKLESIDKWIDTHADVHDHQKEDFQELHTEINNIKNRLILLEQTFQSYRMKFDKKEEEEDEERKSLITQQAEINFAKKKNALGINEEKTKAIIKIGVVIIMILLSVLFGTKI